MHDLFTKVLAKRDLSRAGDLFSVADSDIVADLNEVLSEIEGIIDQPDYLQNKNDQSVMEICVTRVTSCIRETKSVERHCDALVKLLNSCSKHNLQAFGNEEPPHAKISADLISSIFLNYNKKSVMEKALPVAVKFLEKGNRELSKNLASYLSLAAIEYAYLLGPHISQILDSIAIGNYSLCQILPQIYEVNSAMLDKKVVMLVPLLRTCEVYEKMALLQLFTMILKKNPAALESSISQICDTLSTTESSSSQAITSTMNLLLRVADEYPSKLYSHFGKIKEAADKHPTVVSIASQVLTTAGKPNRTRAQFALDFVLAHLPGADRTTQTHTILLRDATVLCSTYPVLFNEKVLACVRQKNNIVSSPATTTTTTSSSVGGGGVSTMLTMTNSVVTSFDEETTTTTTPVAVMKPIVVAKGGKASNRERNNGGHSALMINGSSTLSSTTTTTSGGVTIVKLNMAQPLPQVIQSNKVDSTTSPTTTTGNEVENGPLNGKAMSEEKVVDAKEAMMIASKPVGGGVGHSANITNSMQNGGATSPPHTGYTRRAKLGDSRSTGRLHSSSNTHRSMTRLNVAGGSVGGLHKSMTRLSSSQQINNNSIVNGTVGLSTSGHSSGNMAQIGMTPAGGPHSPNYVTPVPPLSSNVIITGHNKWGIPATKITSGGVTVTTSPPRQLLRPHSQGPSTLLLSGSNSGLGSLTSCNNAYNITNGNVHSVAGSVAVHHIAPASPTASTMTLAVNGPPLGSNVGKQISVSTGGGGPAVTVTSRRNDNTSVTLINATTTSPTMTNQRMSVFEPCPERDTIQHFSEKHYDKIAMYVDQVEQRVPPAAKCTIEERRAKKFAKLHFACQMRGPHCLYHAKTFTMRTRNPKTWIHLMFLDQQARAGTALSSRDPGVSSLKHCWDILKCDTKSFVTLATSAFPQLKDVDAVVNELRNSGYFDVFELGPWSANNNMDGGGGGGAGKDKDSTGSSTETVQMQWGCWLCNHPERAIGFLQGNSQPVIEGQLKEKKGKWRLFRRWRTRYFTLSGAHLSCKGSSGGESIDVNQIRSLKVSRGARNIPKAFEIFTGDQTLILKPKDGKNAEEWVQCLSIVVAHSQARDQPGNKSNSLPARGLGNSRTAF